MKFPFLRRKQMVQSSPYQYLFFEGKFLPIVPLGLQGENGFVKFNVFIDTGASYSLFHASAAEVLGIQLEKGSKDEMTVGDGNALTVYIHTVVVSIAGKEFPTRLGFSREIGVNMNILGRKDIFDKFVICFDEKEKKVTFTSK